MWPGFKSRQRCHIYLLLVLSFAPRGFSPGTPVFPSPQKPTLPNSNSIWNARKRLNELIGTPGCFVGKQTALNETIWRRLVFHLFHFWFGFLCVQMSSGNCEAMDSWKICDLSLKPRSHVRIFKSVSNMGYCNMQNTADFGNPCVCIINLYIKKSNLKRMSEHISS